MEGFDFRSKFPQTFWTEVEAAGKATCSGTPSEQELAALNRLLDVYRRPIVLRLNRRFSLTMEDAEDRYHDFVMNRVLHARC